MFPPDANLRLLVDEDRFGPAAQSMVIHQLQRRGIDDQRVLEQMRTVPRHIFLQELLRPRAYDDSALPTLNDQTISQPYIVALMTQMLEVKPHHHVLEIGTGSGYQTMILCRLAHHVTTIERDGELASSAKKIFQQFGIDHVDVHVGDGTMGYPSTSPYDRILVTAAPPDVPDALLDQLGNRGRMVIPVGDRMTQNLLQVDRVGEHFKYQQGICVRFVPLVGEQGWEEEDG